MDIDSEKRPGRNDTPEHERMITPLLVKFYNTIWFELRLKRISTGQVVDFAGFVEHDEWQDCACLETNPRGATVQEVYDWFVIHCQIDWLKKFSPSEFELIETMGDS